MMWWELPPQVKRGWHLVALVLACLLIAWLVAGCEGYPRPNLEVCSSTEWPDRAPVWECE